MKATVKILRRHLGAQRCAVKHVDLVVVVPGAKMVRLADQCSGMARPVRRDGDTRLQVAVDPVAGDAIAYQRLRLLGKSTRGVEPAPRQARCSNVD